MGKFIKSWAGECSAWECDGLGHLNMRHYMTKVHQARQMFFIHLGLHEAFKADAYSTVRVNNLHIKYLAEARPDNPLIIETGLLGLNETTVRLCHMMFHRDGRMAATIIETVEHVSLRTKAAFPWNTRFREAAKPYFVEQPQPSKPRNLSYDTISQTLNETALIKLGVKPIGLGIFQPHEMGLDRTVTPQALMGRVSETVSHMEEGYPEFMDPEFQASQMSGALLEAQVFFNRRAEAGDGYKLYSGLAECNSYTRKLIHNVVDVVSGENFSSMIGDVCLFDLKARKLVKATEAQLAVLEKNIIKGLTA